MLNKIIAEKIIQEARKQMGQAENITIVSHISPDGDAIGSSLALYHFLRQFKQSVHVLMPSSFPVFFQWMDGVKEIIIGERKEVLAKQLIEQSDLIFCLDFNALHRIGLFADWVRVSDAKKILIDHHPCSTDFCDVTISYTEVSSTCELIFRFVDQVGMLEKINKSCAECIYTGMMTDTGAFTYNSNQIPIYSIIQQLLRKGICKDAIYNQVYHHYSECRMRLQGYVLYKKMKILKEYHTALIILSYEEQQRFQYEKGDTEGFVNIPLAIEKIIFSIFIREEEQKIKLSFRSRGNFPTNQFASEIFHGGGHLNASGGEFNGTLQEVIVVLKKSLPRYKQQLVSIYRKQNIPEKLC